MIDIAKARQVLAAMSPRPWEAVNVTVGSDVLRTQINVVREGIPLTIAYLYRFFEGGVPADAEGIVYIANNFEAMLNELEQQAAIIKALQATLVEERARVLYGDEEWNDLRESTRTQYRQTATGELDSKWPELDWDL